MGPSGTLTAVQGLPASVALVLQGMILLFVLGGDVFTRYRLRLIRHEPAPATDSTPPAEEA